MKRSLLAILLFACLIVPIAVVYSYLKLEKNKIRKEIKHKIIDGIPKEMLVCIKISSQQTHELKWQHSKEFEYKDEMYDIVSKEYIGDTTFYWCWWDNEETLLNKQLSKLLTKALKNDSKHSDPQKHIIDFFKSIYFVSSSQQYMFYFFEQNVIHYRDYKFNILARLTLPLSPPPEFI